MMNSSHVALLSLSRQSASQTLHPTPLLSLISLSTPLPPSPLTLQGEKRLEEIHRLTSATAKLISMFEDPWEELTFRNVGNQGKIFNAVEDRFLLCLGEGYTLRVWRNHFLPDTRNIEVVAGTPLVVDLQLSK